VRAHAPAPDSEPRVARMPTDGRPRRLDTSRG
jgi:hypothetical protein